MKMKVDGPIDKFKARLVIQGFRQKEEIDYFDTYAPFARISTIRLLIALEATHNLVTHQTDVKTTFLNRDLEDKIYMKQQEGFVMLGKCVYCKFDESSKRVIICLYDDDMLIFGTDQNQVDKTKEFLSSNFSMNDMGEADVILGIRIQREKRVLRLHNLTTLRKFSKSLTVKVVVRTRPNIAYAIGKLSRFTSNPSNHHFSTPMETGIKLVRHMGKPVNQLEYSRAIGCLMYAMTSTRSDIAYAIGKLSRFTSNPSNHHCGGAISWASKKQTCITNSTMESEFVALTAARKETEWLRNLIYEIPLWPKPIYPISMHYDSVVTLAKAYSQIYNGNSRHLDHLTKGLAQDLVHKSAIGMGLKCKTKGTTYVSMKFRHFKKLGLDFLYAHEGYGHKAL
ncbi:zinc finger, CCHC-type containing protein [Tanacetum coccineum]|uniref:Zinc finger, CCHC-type containing protein n=1 Tax=Tanacetum coccineum TaxID=301880 RepID=A0ABQ5A702_9ASTR